MRRRLRKNGRVEIRPANGAGGVSLEPCIDAFRVEDVVAVREEAEGVVIVELGETYGALERVLADLELLHRRVGQDGERLDDGVVEAAGTAGQEYGAAWVSVSGGILVVGAAVADVEGDKPHEEEGSD